MELLFVCNILFFILLMKKGGVLIANRSGDDNI